MATASLADAHVPGSAPAGRTRSAAGPRAADPRLASAAATAPPACLHRIGTRRPVSSNGTIPLSGRTSLPPPARRVWPAGRRRIRAGEEAAAEGSRIGGSEASTASYPPAEGRRQGRAKFHGRLRRITPAGLGNMDMTGFSSAPACDRAEVLRDHPAGMPEPEMDPPARRTRCIRSCPIRRAVRRNRHPPGRPVRRFADGVPSRARHPGHPRRARPSGRARAPPECPRICRRIPAR